jgi:hypothetical protein
MSGWYRLFCLGKWLRSTTCCYPNSVVSLQKMVVGSYLDSGSRYWYRGETMPNDLPAEFDEEPGVIEENSF